ncbi:MAG: hypothetical protein P8X90_05740 [Desulfobacterales bacterium]|jgi:hypothetical protein
MNTTVDPAADQSNGAHCLHLTIGVSGNFISSFLGLVRTGFTAHVMVGCSLQDILSNQLGIEENYLQNRVQTIFLNNSPVDDTAGTTVDDGATISLSAAMPGLNGAVMRKGGILASLRHSISLHQSDACIEPRRGKIKLKLFNLIAKEIGPDFLAGGIMLKGQALAEVFALQTPQFWQNVKYVEIDDTRCDAEQLRTLDLSTLDVCLQVRPDQ